MRTTDFGPLLRLLLVVGITFSTAILLFGCGTGAKPVGARNDGGTNIETSQRSVFSTGKIPETDNHAPTLATNSDDDATNPIVRQYNAAVIAKIEKRWDELLARLWPSHWSNGTVVVEFRFHADGTVTELQVVHSTMNWRLNSICKKAVVDPAPFAVWPDEMRRELTNDSRKIRFTFYFE